MTKIGVDRPDQIALISAIQKQIEEIARGKMTAVEVIGVLEFIKLDTYSKDILLKSIQ